MASGTRKLISKEIQQDADTYVGSQGELWFQEGSTTIRFGDGDTPGGIPLTGGATNTGDITFDGVKVQGAGSASGDGAGYATLELVPDVNLYGNDQYIVVDPTAPTHIHLRAGGTPDGSLASLYLGGEQNNVNVNDSGYVSMNAQTYASMSYAFGTGSVAISEGVVAITSGEFEGNQAEWRFSPLSSGEGNIPTHMQFPDLTRQYTAWGGGRVSGVPDTSLGSVGDSQGDLAFSADHLYYCVQSYTDGIANIWKRITWSVDTW